MKRFEKWATFVGLLLVVALEHYVLNWQDTEAFTIIGALIVLFFWQVKE